MTVRLPTKLWQPGIEHRLELVEQWQSDVFVNVMDPEFGALGVGDDDTDAFQKAVATGRPVFVPRPPTHYVIKDQLLIESASGLHMRGEFALGTGSRILCNDFPLNTDVFRMTNPGFPQLQLEGLFFDNNAGNKPRDFFRLDVSEWHGLQWRDLYIQNMGGMGLNVPAPKLAVSWKFDNVHIVSCGAGGMFINNCTALKMNHCRLVNNGGGFDLNIAGTSSGVTLVTPTFDGYWPDTLNFDRVRFTNVQGLTLITPYFEWSSTAATGVLRDIVLDGCSDVVILGGTGSVTPAGTPNLKAIVANNCSNVYLIGPPISTWTGGGTTALEITGGSGFIGFVSVDESKISVDATAAPFTTIYNSGTLIRHRNSFVTPNLTGTTPDSEGAPAGFLVNGSPTNMTNLLGGQSGNTITLIPNDGNTTLVHAAGGTGQFILRGAANYTLPAGLCIILTYQGGAWRESSR